MTARAIKARLKKSKITMGDLSNLSELELVSIKYVLEKVFFDSKKLVEECITNTRQVNPLKLIPTGYAVIEHRKNESYEYITIISTEDNLKVASVRVVKIIVGELIQSYTTEFNTLTYKFINENYGSQRPLTILKEDEFSRRINEGFKEIQERSKWLNK